MTDTIVTSSNGNVLATVESTSIVSTIQPTSVIVSDSIGSTITLASVGNVLVEVDKSTLLVTGMIGPVGPTGISEDDIVYSKRVDFVTDNLLYRGEALVGTSEAASLWRIRRVTIGVDGDVTEVWASGTANFDKVWDNRLLLIYT